MRIGTWNVEYGRGLERNERRRALMESYDADVWVLTESHDSLSPGPEYQPVHSAQRPQASNPTQVVDGSRWVSIWTRLPILSVETDLADPKRTAACLVELGGCRLVVFGTVLPWYRDTECPTGMAAELERQGPNWSGLATAHGAYCCVAGDFNVNIGGDHYYGSKASKAAVAEQLNKTGLTAVTGYDRAGRSDLIDHIALSNDLAPATKVVCIFDPIDDKPGKLSDHRGVVVDVDMGQRNPRDN
jgi:endonuclease/exonuclease/phosphatase family metal-dependent hydrolase